jgi:hypothetical protein
MEGTGRVFSKNAVSYSSPSITNGGASANRLRARGGGRKLRSSPRAAADQDNPAPPPAASSIGPPDAEGRGFSPW